MTSSAFGPAAAPPWWRSRTGLAVLSVAGLAALALAWYLVSPLFIRTRLDESAATGTRLAAGAFSDRDAIHRGSGRASLLRDPAGGLLLHLDNFRVTNGPDLYVYLTPSAQPMSHEDVTAGALQLGRLKAAEGAFSYTIPPGADPAAFKSVVIYCLQFRTIFSVAPLARA